MQQVQGWTLNQLDEQGFFFSFFCAVATPPLVMGVTALTSRFGSFDHQYVYKLISNLTMNHIIQVSYSDLRNLNDCTAFSLLYLYVNILSVKEDKINWNCNFCLQLNQGYILRYVYGTILSVLFLIYLVATCGVAAKKKKINPNRPPTTTGNFLNGQILSQFSDFKVFHS